MQPTTRELDDITSRIIGAAIVLQKKLGPRLRESVYEVRLAHLLVMGGLRVERLLPVPINFGGIHFDEGFRIDRQVEDRVIVEIKSLQRMATVHQKQILTLLRLMDLQIDLLINFGAGML